MRDDWRAWLGAAVLGVVVFVGAIATRQFIPWLTPLIGLTAVGSAALAVRLRRGDTDR